MRCSTESIKRWSQWPSSTIGHGRLARLVMASIAPKRAPHIDGACECTCACAPWCTGEATSTNARVCPTFQERRHGKQSMLYRTGHVHPTTTQLASFMWGRCRTTPRRRRHSTGALSAETEKWGHPPTPRHRHLTTDATRHTTHVSPGGEGKRQSKSDCESPRCLMGSGRPAHTGVLIIAATRRCRRHQPQRPPTHRLPGDLVVCPPSGTIHARRP